MNQLRLFAVSLQYRTMRSKKLLLLATKPFINHLHHQRLHLIIRLVIITIQKEHKSSHKYSQIRRIALYKTHQEYSIVSLHC